VFPVGSGMNVGSRTKEQGNHLLESDLGVETSRNSEVRELISASCLVCNDNAPSH